MNLEYSEAPQNVYRASQRSVEDDADRPSVQYLFKTTIGYVYRRAHEREQKERSDIFDVLNLEEG
jgi:hypothetical protein